MGVASAAAVAGAYLSDCVPGFGLGDGGGPPTATSTPDKHEAPQEESAEDGSIAVAVKGERCTLGEDSPDDCESVCASLEARALQSKSIAIDATLGAHGSVEALKQCLRAAGFERISVHSE